MEQSKSPHVVLLPTPGMGHLIPLVELAKRLVHLHDFSATFIIPGDAPISKAQQVFLEDLPNGVNYHLLPLANTDDLPPDAKIETRMCVMLNRSLPFIRESLKSLLSENQVVAYVADLFGFESLEVAKELGISPYMFFPSTAMLLSLILYLPELDKKVTCEYREMTEPVLIPGCIPLHGRDLLDPVQDRKNDAYRHLLSAEKKYKLAEGIMVNTFNDLESTVIKTLQSNEETPAIYPVGPLVRMEIGSVKDLEGSECLDWLDTQPPGSVLFVSFGSGGTHTHAQMTELAHGLELSEQRFIWVARSPSNGVADANYFSVHSQNDPLAFLPEGFVDRVKGRGLVLPSWAPQALVLSHESTGGFLTHCGWNSTLESVVNGVPLIAWPLYAEQRMNAVMLTEDLKVALRADGNDDNKLIGRDEIGRVVKALMQGEEGKEIRNRMKDLKEAAVRVLSEDGSSAKMLENVAKKWKASKIIG
ncbi:hydroquinone glucosyltransferase-like [Impatiens glandulifera]|uniref:hydroquinone glucosyltransferase-like n=1 Tax=Impatiens glandulifera TaxID=253017 RepID=UPI001FB04D53|nr:hydroquinone glucosyltransferase-like [Impatiens glandulifera]